MNVILIGDPLSKRTFFFRKAANEMGASLRVIDWEALTDKFNLDEFQGAVVKIDPPSYSTVHLSQMKNQIKIYQKNLYHLAQADCRFLNSPEAICRMLDKRETNRILKAADVPVTEMFTEEIATVLQLEEIMREKRCYGVFIKPGYFSGAAGVAAFRMNPVSGRKKLYTSCRFLQGQLVNTKKLICMEDGEEIDALLNHLLALGCVVERWSPKANFHGKSYDLRIVFQFGHVASVVARQSRGPITNLHLNNQAMDIRELGLDETILKQISSVCEKAYRAISDFLDGVSGHVFKNVSMAGIDLLLEKGTMRPVVIEMNGQGDLIYRDVYGENRIYQEQVLVLSGMQEG